MAFTTRHSILGRIRLGEELAWEEFVGHYKPLVLLRARDRGLSATEGEDLLQDLMLELFKGNAVARFEQDRGTRFRDYLKTIIDRCAFRIVRKRGKPAAQVGAETGEVDAADSAPGPVTEFDAKWNAAWRKHLLREAERIVRSEVKADAWKVYTRLVREGANASAVAEELGMTKNNVYVTKHRVLGRMREVVAELEGGE